MFEAFFGFAKTPFSRDIDIRELYLTLGHQEMLERLKYVAERRLFGLFTGEVGSGKTTMIRTLNDQLNQARYRVIYISDSALTPRNFYWEALHQLGQSPRFYRGDAKRQFHATLADLFDVQHKTPVIIIDEGHLLSKEMLEEIRFLMNLRMDSFYPMSLILVGQPEMKRLLHLQTFEAIAQRVNLRFHLPGMELAETKNYVNNHLKVAGVHNPVFTDDALEAIHDFTQGIARKTNNVCTSCLLHAFAGKKNLVDDHLVKVILENEFSA